MEADEDDGDEAEDDEVWVVTWSGPQTKRSTPEGAIPFDPEIQDITGYAKAHIIKLRNAAFNGDARYFKKSEGSLDRPPNQAAYLPFSKSTQWSFSPSILLKRANQRQ